MRAAHPAVGLDSFMAEGGNAEQHARLGVCCGANSLTVSEADWEIGSERFVTSGLIFGFSEKAAAGSKTLRQGRQKAE